MAKGLYFELKENFVRLSGISGWDVVYSIEPAGNI